MKNPIDCTDGSDESSLCASYKTACSSNRCPELSTCKILATGPICVCPKGYKLNDDKCVVIKSKIEHK